MASARAIDLSTFVVWPVVAFCALPPGRAPAQAPAPPRRLAEYAPHVRIDWPHGCVEADGRVVFRDGPIELFACSPHTREHESIVVVDARPLRIYEALGLVGLKPGHPVRWDDVARRWEPAVGDPLRIEVRWQQDGRTRLADIGIWMLNIATDRTLPSGIWRFAGSTRDERGALLADADGTVICVVDFATALIALPESKSASNDALWLRANTAAIPPIGTDVTLVFSPIEPATLELRVGPDGRITYNERSLSMKHAIDRVRRFERDHPNTRILIKADPTTPSLVLDRVRDAVRRAVTRGTIVATEAGSPPPKVDQSDAGGDSDRP